MFTICRYMPSEMIFIAEMLCVQIPKTKLRRDLYMDLTLDPEVFYKKGVLKDFAKFIGKHLYQSFFFNKVVGRTLLFT